MSERELASEANCCTISVCVPIIKRLSFIEHDLRSLAEHFRVVAPKCKSLLEVVISCAKVVRSDILFCWFGSARFLPLVILAKLFSRPVVVVAGGYDVANVPDIAYGNMTRWHSKWLGRALFWLSDTVLAVSHSAALQAVRDAGASRKKVKVVYNGVDETIFSARDENSPRCSAVCVVANLVPGDTYIRKNIDYIMNVALGLPEVTFELIGEMDPDALRRITEKELKNVRILGRKTQKELADIYCATKVYFQPSLHESFGCAVAEAMICGCIPVVADRYALPEVVGGAGILIDPLRVDTGIKAIREILAGTFRPAEDGRERVRSMFSIQARSEMLKDEILRAVKRRQT